MAASALCGTGVAMRRFWNHLIERDTPNAYFYIAWLAMIQLLAWQLWLS